MKVLPQTTIQTLYLNKFLVAEILICPNWRVILALAILFDNILKINLSLPANCCPDTNRFDYVHTINGDVIDFIVIDTAAHLCKCICNYSIEIEMNDLDKNSYQFVCTYYDSIYYNEKVFR